MPAGRRRKRAWNVSGLKNQDGRPTLSSSDPCHSESQIVEAAEESGDEDDSEWQPHVFLDSTRLIVDDRSDSETDEEAPAWEDLEDEVLQENLVKMARKQGDDPDDENWLPYQELKKQRKQSENKKRAS
jgi:hypothetical protein